MCLSGSQFFTNFFQRQLDWFERHWTRQWLQMAERRPSALWKVQRRSTKRGECKQLCSDVLGRYMGWCQLCKFFHLLVFYSRFVNWSLQGKTIIYTFLCVLFFFVYLSSGSMPPLPPPGPVKISHKKMAAKGSRIDFMFHTSPYPAAGSATLLIYIFT